MSWESPLRLGGLTPFTSIDFPGRLAAVFHCQGCPLACPYCHTPHLRAAGKGALSWPEALAWLAGRTGLLDGVVFSGGEPCAQTALGHALAACRDLGFATAVHSSGLYPQRLAKLMPLLDWVGLDWKAPPAHTFRATGREGLGARFHRSLEIVLASGIAHEIRTTYHPRIFSGSDLTAMAQTLADHGASRWVIQEFSPTGVADETLRAEAFSLPANLLAELGRLVPEIVFRPAAGGETSQPCRQEGHFSA